MISAPSMRLTRSFSAVALTAAGFVSVSLLASCASDAGDAHEIGFVDQGSHGDAWRRSRQPSPPLGPGGSGGAAPSGGATSTGEATSTGGTTSPPSPHAFQALEPCLTEASYVRTAVVRVASTGCSPSCVRLASGGTVVFLGLLAEAPIEPRLGGSPLSPITAASAGGVVEFEFMNHGFFPYRCGGDSGVIWSTTW